MMRFVLSVLVLIWLFAVSNAGTQSIVGINYGRLAKNLPSPYKSIETIKSLNAGLVKLYDADPETLRLLTGTKIPVSIMVPNSEIISIGSSQASANKWVHDNVLTYYPETMIRYILVGNEVLSYSTPEDKRRWNNIVPAMKKITTSLRSQNISNIKLGTPLAMDVLESTFPPSEGRFRSDVSNDVIPNLLKFINGTKSFFFIDVYPYFPWSANPSDVSLDSALLRSDHTYTDPGSELVYTNLLDQMLDSIIFAMAKLGYPEIRLFISETGWPNGGDIDQSGANMYNAATYNRNIIRRMTAHPAVGTPARPGVSIPTILFSLYDEDGKQGPGTERHWGLCNSDGDYHYEIDLSRSKNPENYQHLSSPDNNTPFTGKIWCVVAQGANSTELQQQLDYVCSHGNATCAALMPGRECYKPLQLGWHASYAFSSYWKQFRSSGASCYFNGLAVQTSKNPSHGSCRFPSVVV